MWYLSHQLSAIPINPRSSSITVQSRTPSSIATIASPSALGSDAPQTSLSIITPPAVTRILLQEAKQVGVRAVWLQPGSFDKETLEWTRKEWPNAAIGGTDVKGSRGHDGWCILVDGEWGLDLAGRKDGSGERL